MPQLRLDLGLQLIQPARAGAPNSSATRGPGHVTGPLGMSAPSEPFARDAIAGPAIRWPIL